VLCTQGDIGREFFVLTDGLVTVSRDGELLADLGSGDWFGEVALTSSRRRRIASVVTTAVSRVLVFDLREFRAMVARCPLVERRLNDSSVLRTASFPASRFDVALL
jgi:CRP-like cAMP-binding protein